MQPDICSDAYYQSELSCHLLESIEGLSEHERLVVVYHYFGSLSFQEVADILGKSKGRISQLHKAALTKIKTHLVEGAVYSTYL